MPDLAAHLAALDPEQLAALLVLRPDALWQPLPRDLTDLAQRLDDPVAVSEVLEEASVPVLQAAEALQALGGSASRHDLLGLLGAHDQDAGADRALGWLLDRAVLRPGATGATGATETSLVASPALAACFPTPLGLGPPLAHLSAGWSSSRVTAVLRELGLPRPAAAAQARERLLAHFADAGALRALLAGAAPEARRRLEQLARDAALGGGLPAVFGTSPAERARDRRALDWLSERALVVEQPWGYGHQVPAEVLRALRGPDHRAPFTPSRPRVATSALVASEVEAESAAAAATCSAHATAVLDALARSGAAVLKNGGVGARELTRLAKTTGASSTVVRLVLELAGALGLLTTSGGRLVTGGGFARWRHDEPGPRLAALVTTWWQLGTVPTKDTEDGKALPALRGEPPCVRCAGARRGLLSALAQVPAGRATDLASVGEAAVWTRPLVHAVVADGEVPFAAPWREAELLGLVARGALSELGRHLVEGDARALEGRASAVLPATADEALFLPDLTAVVAGTPSARLSALLDACADREGRGGAVVWRLSPGSVRRALDEGASGGQLERDLAAVARGELPQPLRYLLADVARRHGSLRVRPAVAVVRSEDAALLAQAAADRSLRRLGLAVLAPTVLSSAVSAEEAVQALRAAGYLPVAEDSSGQVVLPRRASGSGAGSGAGSDAGSGSDAGAGSGSDAVPGRRRGAPVPGQRRAAPAPAGPEPVGLAGLAAVLLRAGVGGTAAPGSGTERTIAALAPRLAAPDRRLLAHALDTDGDVVITYLSSTGGLTQRQVGQLALSGGGLHAWCELRQDERWFTVSRIQSVRPVTVAG